MRYLKRSLAGIPNLDTHCKSPRQERLQALLSLGDRRLAPVMLRMARGETDLNQALGREGLSLDFYIHRPRPVGEILPWGHIDNGMKTELLVSQYERSKHAPRSPAFLFHHYSATA
jgi:hypothetical protein